MKAFGIDTSIWNGDFDFARAKSKEGIEFAIIKGGGRSLNSPNETYVDREFINSYTSCKTLDIPMGCYWFANFANETECDEEADFFIKNCLAGRRFALPVFVDVEADRMLELSKEHLTSLVIRFCQRLEDANYFVGIYSSSSAFRYEMDDNRLTRFVHWVAHWGKTPPDFPASCFGVWQFGGETNKIRSPLINGCVVDQNYMLIDYPNIIPATGRNGFSTPEKDIDLDEVANDVIRGVYGTGLERMKKLESLGYSYVEVQTLVNKKLGIGI